MQSRVRPAGSTIAWALLSLLHTTAIANAEVVRSGFDVVPVTVGELGRSAPREPAYTPSTNLNGDVAYLVVEEDRERLEIRDAIGVVHPVIATGEPLAGSAVTRLVTMANSLDAYQQVLMWAALADGRAGLFRASPVPMVFAISPETGYRDQLITVQLTGRGFAPGMRIRVGGRDAGMITVISPSELTAILQAGTRAGRADVAVSRPYGTVQTLRDAFEFQDRPLSGCRGFWPDHRPPVVTASAVLSGWLAPIALIAVPSAWRRFSRRRWARRVHGDGPPGRRCARAARARTR